jgi:hypothetical protein
MKLHQTETKDYLEVLIITLVVLAEVRFFVISKRAICYTVTQVALRKKNLISNFGHDLTTW